MGKNKCIVDFKKPHFRLDEPLASKVKKIIDEGEALKSRAKDLDLDRDEWQNRKMRLWREIEMTKEDEYSSLNEQCAENQALLFDYNEEGVFVSLAEPNKDPQKELLKLLNEVVGRKAIAKVQKSDLRDCNYIN